MLTARGSEFAKKIFKKLREIITAIVNSNVKKKNWNNFFYVIS